MNGTTAYVLSKKFTTDTASSLGSLKGAPCTVGNVTTDALGNTVIELRWENNAGASQSMDVTIAKGLDGLYVKSAAVDVNNHLIITLSDNSTIDAGEMPQAKVEISKEPNNAIETKTDGLYVSKTGIVISPDTGNALKEKANGLYVPETDLKDYAKTADVVEKEAGKGLSTNDFTNSLKTKLDNLPDDAQKNVQSDWNESNPTSDAFILNKPTIPDGVTISKDTDNQLVEGSDKGLYVAKCPVDNALSITSENPVQNKLVAEALNNRVEKETGKELVSTTDIAQITTNKTDIETLKGDDTVIGSVAKQIKEKIGDLSNLKTENTDNVVSAINEVNDSLVDLESDLGKLDKSTKSTIVTTSANLLFTGATQLGIGVTDKFQLFKITAFCEDGYNIALAKYKHDASLSLKTISNNGTTITASNKVGTVAYSGALKCAYIEYIGVADESVNFGSWEDKTELATMDKVANDFRKTVITKVTGIADGDVAIVPPSGASNYIPINARPLGTWNTIPILFYHTNDKQHYLHSVGSDVQEYEIEWITS